MLFLVIFVLCLLTGLLLPWWMIAIIAFLSALFMGKTPGKSFVAGLLGVAAAWAILALIKSVLNENILAGRVAVLFHLPGWFWVVVVSSIIGGLVGGFAALSGMFFKRAFTKTEKR